MALPPAPARIHIIGIGGSGMSAIARILIGQGYRVSGSDRASSPLSDALIPLGAIIHNQHGAAHVSGAAAVITTSAVPPDHVEIAAAHAANIPVYKRRDILADLMHEKRVIAVAGTHGKTTTTSMIAHILHVTRRDPSYLIGGVLTTTGVNAAVSAGECFVVEADEYDYMFLGLNPDIAVVTNVEWDHPDFFATPQDMIDAFTRFVARITPQGTLIVCADDAGAADLMRLTFPPRLHAYTAADIPPNLHLEVQGQHNQLNATAAIMAVGRAGVPPAEAIRALESFKGAGRRFDVRADAGGIAVIDDYAHHPTAIRATLAAAKQRYPDRTIWAVWQPHTFSRTRALWNDYLRAFADADHVVVTDIYAARETPDAETTAARFVVALDHPSKQHTPSLNDAAALLIDQVSAPAAIVIMSAGDAPQIGVMFVRNRL